MSTIRAADNDTTKRAVTMLQPPLRVSTFFFTPTSSNLPSSAPTCCETDAKWCLTRLTRPSLPNPSMEDDALSDLDPSDTSRSMVEESHSCSLHKRASKSKRRCHTLFSAQVTPFIRYPMIVRCKVSSTHLMLGRCELGEVLPDSSRLARSSTASDMADKWCCKCTTTSLASPCLSPWKTQMKG